MTNHKSQWQITNHNDKSPSCAMPGGGIAWLGRQSGFQLGEAEERDNLSNWDKVGIVRLNYENEKKICSYKIPSYRCKDGWKRFQANGSTIFTRDVVVTCHANKTWSRSSTDIPCKSEFQMDFLVHFLRFLLPLSPWPCLLGNKQQPCDYQQELGGVHLL